MVVTVTARKSLDLIEFAEMASDLIARQEAEAEIKAIREAAPQRLRETFDRFDADSDGELTHPELALLLQQVDTTAPRTIGHPAPHAAAAAAPRLPLRVAAALSRPASASRRAPRTRSAALAPT